MFANYCSFGSVLFFCSFETFPDNNAGKTKMVEDDTLPHAKLKLYFQNAIQNNKIINLTTRNDLFSVFNFENDSLEPFKTPQY